MVLVDSVARGWMGGYFQLLSAGAEVAICLSFLSCERLERDCESAMTEASPGPAQCWWRNGTHFRVDRIR